MSIRHKIVLLAGVITLSILTGCIKDDYDDCTQGINVRFYSKTSCQIDTVYPEQISNITLCVFDKNDRLVSLRRSNDVKIQKDYSQKVEVNEGLYTVVAWAGLDDSHFDINQIQTGATQKSDLLFRLKRVLQQASTIDGKRIYYGEGPAVYVPQASGSETLFENTSVNMLEITNRITITVEGLTRAEDYLVEIESDNGAMNIDGSIASDEVLEYEGEHLVRDGIMDARFTVLKLETGHVNTIVVKSKINGEELYRGSLLGTLLLKNPDVNLDCDHDFTIRFTAKDQCDCGTYMITEIWVNNWLVHSYDTEM